MGTARLHTFLWVVDSIHLTLRCRLDCSNLLWLQTIQSLSQVNLSISVIWYQLQNMEPVLPFLVIFGNFCSLIVTISSGSMGTIISSHNGDLLDVKREDKLTWKYSGHAFDLYHVVHLQRQFFLFSQEQTIGVLISLLTFVYRYFSIFNDLNGQ